MADIIWSPEQLEAIQSCNENVLLNAGAGSGKTAVLSEHVIYLLKEKGFKLDKFLIMTFTNAAASEMKNRIRKKIKKDPELFVKYGDQIDACHIETFDAFFLFLVKKYHYVLNINKNLNILDGNLLNTILEEYIDDAINKEYKNQSDKFLEVVKKYCVKDDHILNELILKLLKQANLALNKEEFLNTFVDHFYCDEFVDHLINLRFEEMRNIIHLILEKSEQLEDDKDVSNIAEWCNTLLSATNYDDLFMMTQDVGFPTKPRSKALDIDYRNAIKKIYEDNIKANKNNYGNSFLIKQNHMANKDLAEVIVYLTKIVDKKLTDFKNHYNAYDFSDVAKLALKLTDFPDILQEIKDSFDYIMVDEYQDTSDIQEAMLLKLQNKNMFMVGDVKQSIYRFRNANCLIFQNKYEAYKKNNPIHQQVGEHAIDMTKNFRSRHELVDDFNKYFAILMQPKYNVIDYVKGGHITRFGFDDYDKIKDHNQEYHIQKYIYSDTEELPKAEYEARIVAKDIIEKINNHHQIYDNGKLRNCRFSDFAIIMDRGGEFNTYKRIFNEYNIPLFVNNDEKVSKKTMFLLVPNLLKVFNGVKNNDYSGAFNHSYASVARSFLVEKTDEEIYHTIKNKSYISDDLIIRFKSLVEKYKNNSLFDIITAIFDEFDIYNAISKVGDYYVMSNDIQIVLNLMSNMDQIEYTLDDAIKYFSNINNYEVEIKASTFKESDNSVTLINIHKSKGLEYSICYYTGLYKGYNKQDVIKTSNVSSKFGLYAPSNDNDIENLARHLYINDYNQQDFEEKLRLLYVAFTRAKEEAIIVDCFDDKDFIDLTKSNSNHEILSAIEFDPKYIKNISNILSYQICLNSNELNNNKTSFNEQFILNEPINIQTKEIIKSRASKEKSDEVDQSSLDFGTKMHLLLELASGPDDDLSYIKDELAKKRVRKVLDCPVFKGVKPENIRHEFGFYDENKELLGYIDCMLIKQDEIDIIDFKLKKIDDAAYKKQLQVYYVYIKSLNTGKKVKTYLLSIVDGIQKEVKMDE